MVKVIRRENECLKEAANGIDLDESVRRTISDNEKLKEKLRKYYNAVQDTKKVHMRILEMPFFKAAVENSEEPNIETAASKVVAEYSSSLEKIASLEAMQLEAGSQMEDLSRLRDRLADMKNSHHGLKMECENKTNKIEDLNNLIAEKETKICVLGEKVSEVETLLQNNVCAHKESVRFLEKENLDLMLEVKRLKKNR